MGRYRRLCITMDANLETGCIIVELRKNWAPGGHDLYHSKISSTSGGMIIGERNNDRGCRCSHQTMEVIQLTIALLILSIRSMISAFHSR